MNPMSQLMNCLTPQDKFALRVLTPDDREEYAGMLYRSFNTWYAGKGWDGDYFHCAPTDAGIFFDIYQDLTPGCSAAAFDRASGGLAGACFYHPREHHMSLGIMSVEPAFFGQGVGHLLVDTIIRYAESAGYPAVRLVGSAINMNSFSLYNRSGFIPRHSYQGMRMAVPAAGIGPAGPGRERVRPAQMHDMPAMRALELAVSGIARDLDYRYAIANPREVMSAAVLEGHQDGIDGFALSVKHPALSMIGPLVARTEEDAIVLLMAALKAFRGSSVLLVVPMYCRKVVSALYEWGARNVETHLLQVRGEFRPFTGVNFPSFLPETG